MFLQSELSILLSPGQGLFVHTHHVFPLSLRRVDVQTLQKGHNQTLFPDGRGGGGPLGQGELQEREGERGGERERIQSVSS